MLKTLFTFLFLVLNLATFCQSKKDFDYSMDLGMPIKIDMILAGNFCEMRSNHFHTGIDIKTNRKEGYRLYAIEDGYLSRIRVSPWGYGKTIYIQYNNGLTSVYAHCSDFPPLLDSLIYTIQKAQESAIIDEDILALKIPVKRGDIVAFSGNSGSSSAPHLHFEIRETISEHAINPLLFDCYRNKIEDTTPPEIRGLKLYALSKEGFMIPGRSIYLPISQDSKKINNKKAINIDTLITKDAVLGIGVYAIDKLNGAWNTCGIYSSRVFSGDQAIHEQVINYMDFDVNRYLNTHKDYFAFKHLKQHIHKQFTNDINPLPIYPEKGGLISWSDIQNTFKLVVKDVHGNITENSFTLTKSEQAKPRENPLNEADYYFPNEINAINLEGFEAIIEKGQFYEPVEKKTGMEEASKPSFLSAVYQLFEYNIPVQSGINMRIKIDEKHKNLPLTKLGIVLLDEKNRLYFKGGYHDNGWITHKIRHFGKFTLMIDTIPPTIKPLDYKNNQNISKYSTLEFNLGDNLSGVASYKAYINDKWVPAFYNRKKRHYIIYLNNRTKQHLLKGNNKLTIKVIDKVKNMREQTLNLIYQQ